MCIFARDMQIIMSIRPKFAQAIIDGSKLYEYRKTIPKRHNIKKVYVYASKPIKGIVARFIIKKVICDTPQKVWELTHEHSGISEKEFFDYFRGRDKVYALHIENVLKFDMPIDPKSIFNSFTVPQNYVYIENNEGLRKEERIAKKLEKNDKEFLDYLTEAKEGKDGLIRDILEKSEKAVLGRKIIASSIK